MPCNLGRLRRGMEMTEQGGGYGGRNGTKTQKELKRVTEIRKKITKNNRKYTPKGTRKGHVRSFYCWSPTPPPRKRGEKQERGELGKSSGCNDVGGRPRARDVSKRE